MQWKTPSQLFSLQFSKIFRAAIFQNMSGVEFLKKKKKKKIAIDKENNVPVFTKLFKYRIASILPR